MKETSMSSSFESSSHNGPYFIMSDSDDSISNARNPAFIPVESDRIVMVSPPTSDEDEEVSHAPPVVGENMDLDNTTVAVRSNNDGVVDLERDMDFVVSKRSDFDDGDSSTDTVELLLSLKNCCPGSEAESELQILDTNFEAVGPSARKRALDISTETEERNMQSENISIPEAMNDQQPTRKRALPPSRFISSMEKNKEPMGEKNLTSPVNGTGSVGEDGRTDVEKQNVTESEPVDPVGKKKRFNILDLLRKLASEEEDTDEDRSLACLSLLEVAERRWGKF